MRGPRTAAQWNRLVDRTRDAFRAGRYGAALAARSSGGLDRGQAELSPQNWFWFNAFGALAGYEVAPHDQLTHLYVSHALQACDHSDPAQADAVNAINARFFGPRNPEHADTIAELMAEHARRDAPRDAPLVIDEVERPLDFLDSSPLMDRGQKLLALYAGTGDRSALDEVVDICNHALSVSHSARVTARLLELRGYALARRWPHGRPQDLFDAAEDTATALELADDEDLVLDIVKSRSDILRELTEQTGDCSHIDAAVDMTTKQLAESPQDTDLIFALSNCLLTRFEYTLRLDDLRDARRWGRYGLSLGPSQPISGAIPLAAGLATFQMEGDPAALVDAIESGERAFAGLSPSDYRLPEIRRTLSIAYSRLYAVTKEPAALKTAVVLARASLEDPRSADSQRPAQQMRLTHALLDLRQEVSATSAERAMVFDEASALVDQLRKSVTQESRTYPHYLELLTRMASIRGEAERDLASVDHALDLVARHAEGYRDSAYARARVASVEASLYRTRYTITGNDQDLTRALTGAAAAVDSDPNIVSRLDDLRRLIELLTLAHDRAVGSSRDRVLDQVVARFDQALAELQARADNQAYHTTVTWLRTFPSLASEAAGAYRRAQQLTSAVDALERTRCHQWNRSGTSSPLAAELRALEYAAARIIDGTPGARDTQLTLTSIHEQITALKRRLLETVPAASADPALTVRNLAAGLGANEALVYLVPAGAFADTPWALVVGAGSELSDVSFSDVDAGELGTILQDFLAAGHGEIKHFQSRLGPGPRGIVGLVDHVGQWLDRNIVQPLIAHVGSNIDSLVIIPIGPLALLPMQAASHNGRPLLETIAVRFLLAGHQINSPRPLASALRPLTVFAPPLGHLAAVRATLVQALSTFDPLVDVEMDALPISQLVDRIDGASSALALCHGSAGSYRTDTVLHVGDLKLAFHELDRLIDRPRSIFWIAACCCRTPLQHLPDELIGFPQSLARSGFAGVVASGWRLHAGAALATTLKFAQLAMADPAMFADQALNDAQLWMRQARSVDVAELIDDFIASDMASEAARTFRDRYAAGADSPAFPHAFEWAGLTMVCG